MLFIWILEGLQLWVALFRVWAMLGPGSTMALAMAFRGHWDFALIPIAAGGTSARLVSRQAGTLPRILELWSHSHTSIGAAGFLITSISFIRKQGPSLMFALKKLEAQVGAASHFPLIWLPRSVFRKGLILMPGLASLVARAVRMRGISSQPLVFLPFRYPPRLLARRRGCRLLRRLPFQAGGHRGGGA